MENRPGRSRLPERVKAMIRISPVSNGLLGLCRFLPFDDELV